MKTLKKRLDTRRGRKPRVAPHQVALTSEHYRKVFGAEDVWTRLLPRLRRARTDEDVATAFKKAFVPDAHYFVPSLSPLIRQVIRDPDFPKSQMAQVKFFADSLAGRGMVEPRRARDIVGKEHARAKRAHRILRYEFYIECSCGYLGASRDFRCVDCGALIEIDPFYGIQGDIAGLRRTPETE